jgi:hypothetical protein
MFGLAARTPGWAPVASTQPQQNVRTTQTITVYPWSLRSLRYSVSLAYPACSCFRRLTASPSPLFNSRKTIVETRVIPPSTKNARWMP